MSNPLGPGTEAKQDATAKVSAWNVACRTTVSTYLPHLDWKLDQAIPPAPDWPGRPPRWVVTLHNEVATKVSWMGELQRELHAQSSSAAISSQVQT
jgi:squalene cyclase